MSARHRKKLSASQKSSKGKSPLPMDEEDESSDADDFPVISKPPSALLFDSDSDDSDTPSQEENDTHVGQKTTAGSENDEEEENENLTPSTKEGKGNKKGGKKKKKKKQQQKSSTLNAENNSADDELEFLTALAQSAQSSESSSSSAALRIDADILNIDQELRRKFGNIKLDCADGGKARRQGAAGTRGDGGGGGHSRGVSKKSMFCNPSDEWPYPPSFVAGGIGVKAVEDGGDDDTSSNSSSSSSTVRHFEFQVSAEAAQQDSQFALIQESGDVESMALFLAEHPCHTEALITLATVCLRTGGLLSPI